MAGGMGRFRRRKVMIMTGNIGDGACEMRTRLQAACPPLVLYGAALLWNVCSIWGGRGHIRIDGDGEEVVRLVPETCLMCFVGREPPLGQ